MRRGGVSIRENVGRSARRGGGGGLTTGKKNTGRRNRCSSSKGTTTSRAVVGPNDGRNMDRVAGDTRGWGKWNDNNARVSTLFMTPKREEVVRCVAGARQLSLRTCCPACTNCITVTSRVIKCGCCRPGIRRFTVSSRRAPLRKNIVTKDVRGNGYLRFYGKTRQTRFYVQNR